MRLINWLCRKDREIGVVFIMPHGVTDDRINEILMKATIDTEEIKDFKVIIK